ncbi:MAG: DNA repair protein RecN [Paludibacteraceae bacterium]
MLRHLHIEHYALISHLDIDFEGGFSVLTGETGAGKSIILGALALVMGARADSKAITDGEEKCIIEAEFDIIKNEELRVKSPAEPAFDTIIIRRELYANGKSRSFVDDSVVTLAELKGLSARLIDIHSQHANLLLENDDFQRDIVDALAQNEREREAYLARYHAYRETEKALQELEALAKKSKADADYVQYRHHLLEDAHLEDEDELNALEEEQYMLSHAEDIRRALETCAEAIEGDNGGTARDVLRLCDLREAAPDLQERIDSVVIELRDIAREASRKAERTEVNPERLMQVEERIGLLQDLLRKFDAEDLDGLMAQRDELAEQCRQMENFDEDLTRLRKTLSEQEKALATAAAELRLTRERVREPISRQLENDLTQLGIIHAKIDIAVGDLEDYTETGKDNVQFLFAANLNQSLRPVSDVASGGEMSRIMLCIKALIASANGLPTIIFDEIDTGVSGGIAGQMGEIMRQMAASRQIIAITHLPQIAAKAEHHYLVYKQDTDMRTESHIRRLSAQEHQDELAKMVKI